MNWSFIITRFPGCGVGVETFEITWIVWVVFALIGIIGPYTGLFFYIYKLFLHPFDANIFLSESALINLNGHTLELGKIDIVYSISLYALIYGILAVRTMFSFSIFESQFEFSA